MDMDDICEEGVRDSSDGQVKEFVRAVLHVYGDEHEAPYHDLLSRLEEGRPFVVGRSSRYVRGFSVFAPESALDGAVDVRISWMYGTLVSAVRFDANKGFVVIPTGNYFVKNGSLPWKHEKGDMYIDAFDMRHYGKALSPKNPRSLLLYTGASLSEIILKVGCPFAKQ
jgi:hypothetical protein